ncbi:MAG: lipid-A-disaccharide synthase [Bacteroidales bacterium]
MRYYIIAGEASGDMHAANLMGEIQNLDKNWNFRYWGGDRMQDKGGDLVKHYKHHSFMGFAEVILHLPSIIKNLNQCKQDIVEYSPDVLILVDYPGFNLRIAEFAHKQGIKVAYYISPKIWAWKENRIHKIKKVVDRMFVILPFEKGFYNKHDMEVTFVGHPLLDELKMRRQTFDHNQFRTEYGLDERPLVALLPGSRKQEIKRMLPVMVEVANKYPEYQYVIAGTKHIPQQLYQNIIRNSEINLLIDKTYPVLQIAKAGMITSGTASLETALFHVPQLVMYKTSRISYWIAKKLVNLNYISIANLIFDREIFKEFIQNECNVPNVSGELYRLLVDQNYRKNMLEDYTLLEQKLGGSGASEYTAKCILKMVDN